MSNDMPDPVEIKADQEAMAAMFPNGDPHPADPRGAAWMWWTAVVAGSVYENAFRNLSTERFVSQWTLAAVRKELDGLGFDTRLHRQDLSHATIKFSRAYSHTVRAFAEFELPPGVRLVRLVRCSDRWWRVDALEGDPRETAENLTSYDG